MKPKEFLSIFALLTLAISIPLIVFSFYLSFEMRKRALVEVGPATLALLPESGTFAPGDDLDIDINLDTGGEEVYGFALTLTFDSDILEVQEAHEEDPVDTSSDTFGFSWVLKNEVSGGTIEFDAAINPGGSTISGTGTLGTLKLKVKEGASGQASVDFVTSGDGQSTVNTYDGDILGTVHGGTYTIQGPDTTAPETEITGGPSEGETITTDEATFTFSGSDNETDTEELVYSWRLEKEGTTVTDWTGFSNETEANLSELSTGNYTFKVKAKDEAGNEDASPTTRNFSVSLGECAPGETQDCTAENTCEGEQGCGDDRTWGECVTEENHCDEDCDGTPETCQLEDCSECACVGDEARPCTTEDNFKGTQACAEGTWETCEKDEPYDCAAGYELCDDDICLLDCGDCVPEETEECVTSDHFKGEKTCTSERAWGECIKGADCEKGYEKCPDSTCQKECTAATLNFTFKLGGRARAKKDPIKIFARESGSDANFGQAPWKQNLTIETDSDGNGSVSGLSLEGLDFRKSYEFLLKGPQHLQKKKTIASLEAENSLDFGLLQAGDLNGNGTIGGDDISIWVHEIEGEEKEEYQSDINADGLLNGADVSIIIHNLKLRGDE